MWSRGCNRAVRTVPGLCHPPSAHPFLLRTARRVTTPGFCAQCPGDGCWAISGSGPFPRRSWGTISGSGLFRPRSWGVGAGPFPVPGCSHQSGRERSVSLLSALHSAPMVLGSGNGGLGVTGPSAPDARPHRKRRDPSGQQWLGTSGQPWARWGCGPEDTVWWLPRHMTATSR